MSINGRGDNGKGDNGKGDNGKGDNGKGDNGKGDNGKGDNGEDNNGRHINAKEVSNGELSGEELTDIKLDPGNITAVSSDNELLSGSGLVGATFNAKLVNGTPVSLRIDAVDDFNWHGPLPPQYPSDSVYAYTISVKYAGQNAWFPVCGKDGAQPRRATPLAGRWNYSQGVPGGGDWIDDPDAVTFACEGYALYKCVAFGYAPWVTFDGHDLADYHQACTRLIRADYCGDGRSWTKDGTWINLYDNIAIQQDDADWAMEAEWTPQGARCLSHQRLQNKERPMPDCAFELPASSCGAPPHWNDTLLVTEFDEN